MSLRTGICTGIVNRDSSYGSPHGPDMNPFAPEFCTQHEHELISRRPRQARTDQIAYIKAYWVMMTPRMAQIALKFGADDLDGTIVEERIYHDAGATTSQGLRRNELLHLIRKAGREPIERDTLYRPVQRTESTFTVLV